MSDEDTKLHRERILAQLRARAWYWLYRQSDLQRGLAHISSVSVERAGWSSPGELEVQAASNLPGTYENRVTAVHLRLTATGSLSLTTECGSCGRPHCWHTAALLARLMEPDAARVLVKVTQAAPARSEQAQLSEKTGGFTAAKSPPTTAPDPPRIIESARMQPVLELRRVKGDLATATKRGKTRRRQTAVGVAIPRLVYEGCTARFYLAASRLTTHHEFNDEEGRRVLLRRELYRERSLLTELRMSGLDSLGVVLPDFQPEGSTTGALTVPLDQQALFWARFRDTTVAALVEDGWQVEIAPDFGFEILTPDEDTWFSDLDAEEGGGTGHWFRLNLGFAIADRRISLVPVLSRALDEGLTPEVLVEAAEEQRDFLLVLEGEEGDPVVNIAAARLLPLMRLLTELMSLAPGGRASAGAGQGGLRLDRLRAAQLSGLEELRVNAPELARLRERLAAFEEIHPVPPPAGLRAEMRDYQRAGLAWLQFLREFDLHGVLADDMGLGKTLQTIAHLLVEHEQGRADRPSLVIAPTSVLRNWQREIERFAPDLRVLLLHGTERRRLFKKLPAQNVVITSYPLLVRDLESLQKTPWHLVVLDEAQNIKNPRSQAAQAAAALAARHRLCLTGTPMENHLGELWSLFHFLMPGFLGEADSFRRAFRNPIEKKQDRERQELLSRRLQPLLLRRTKDAVARELPPKTELLHHIEIEGAQADLYETIRALMDERVREAIAARGMDRSHIVVLDALLKLRQVCCHPRLLKAEAARAAGIDSAKLSYLLDDLLPELLEEGRRVLIFSQFTEMLAIIEAEFRRAGLTFVKLTGSTKDRETPVRRFQEGEVPLFLISLKAGGAGLNLTAADTVIHYDPWWNPAAEAQASDRAHRIGQTKPVFIHKLICAGTIEDKILELQRSKAALLASLLGGGDRARLSPEDLQQLLAPL